MIKCIVDNLRHSYELEVCSIAAKPKASDVFDIAFVSLINGVLLSESILQDLKTKS